MTRVHDDSLQHVIAAIQRRWGDNALRPLSQHAPPHPALPTGFAALDDLLGGWPRGRVSLVTGGASAGLATLGLYALAAAQREDRPALIVDVGRALDPAAAVRCGVDLEQVLVVWPPASTLGLEIVRDVVAVGGSGMILLDASLPGFHVRQHRPSAGAVHALAAALPRTGWVVLCLAAPRDSFARAVAPYAGLRLQVERTGWQRAGRDITGCTVRVTLCQHPTRPPGRSAALTLSFSEPLPDVPV